MAPARVLQQQSSLTPSPTAVRRIRRVLAVAAAVAAIVAACAFPHGGSAPVLITNFTLLAGDSFEPQAASVVVTNGRIQAIVPGRAPAVPDAAIVDGHGGYLVPGFIDMHAHLMVPRCAPGPDGTAFDRAVSERMLAV